MGLELGQRIAQGVDLFAVIRVGKQVGLDGATGFHRDRALRGSGWRDFTKRRVEGGFSRCPTGYVLYIITRELIGLFILIPHPLIFKHTPSIIIPLLIAAIFSNRPSFF